MDPKLVNTEAAILKPFEDDFEATLHDLEQEFTAVDMTNKRHRALFVSSLLDLTKARYKPEEATHDLTSLQKLIKKAEEVVWYDDGALGVAQHLLQLVVLLEGDPDALLELLQLIQLLSVSEDPKVVLEAAASINELVSSNTDESLLTEHLVPMLYSFATSPYAAPRSCAALTLHSLYPFFEDEDQERLLSLFHQLCHDSDIFVRRNAIQAISDWMDVLGSDAPKVIMPLLGEFSKELDHDSIRVQLLFAVTDVCQKLTSVSAKAELCRLVILLAQDESWRVRYVMAKNIAVLAGAFSASALTPSIVLLSQDEETEVRAATAAQLGALCEGVVPQKLLSDYLDIVATLAEDESVVVRTSVAGVLCTVFAQCTAVPEAQRLMELIFKLLGETDSVRVRIIDNMWKLGSPILSDQKYSSQMANVLHQAMIGAKWRLREAAASSLKHLASFATLPAYQTFVTESISNLLVDPVASVRKALIASLSSLSRKLGERWSLRTVMELLPHSTNPTFRHRQAFTAALEVLLPLLEDKPSEEMTSIGAALVELSNDPVSNVRIAVGHILSQSIWPTCLNVVRKTIADRLDRDTDGDVRSAAASTLAPF
jgi:serine/threonine-protein phosphatase 2A regulatory subunit A